MANVNIVILAGNLTRDIELKYLPSGSPVVEFGIAVNRKWTSADGQAKEEVTFVDCTAFAKTAELIAKYFKKGDPIMVEGRLKLDQWDAQDGTKRSKLRVIVEKFHFMKSGGGQRGGDEQPRQQQRYGRPQQQQDEAPAPDDFPGDDVPF